MKNLKTYEEFINENASHKSYLLDSFRLKREIREISEKCKLSDIYTTLSVDEILAFESLDEVTNEGLFSKIKNKINSLISKKSDVSGEGSRKKKEQIADQIEKLESQKREAKEKYNKQKEELEAKGYIEDEDAFDKYEELGLTPFVDSIKNPEGETRYYVMKKEKIKEENDKQIKKLKDEGYTRWKPKGDENKNFPDKDVYDEIEPIATTSGNSIFYVKKAEKDVSDKIQEIDDKMYNLEKKINTLDKKIEDDFDGDGSDPGAKKLMDIQSKLRDAIKKLESERDKLNDEG